MNVLSIDVGEKNLGWTVARIPEKYTGTTEIKDIEFTSGIYDLEISKTHSNVVLARVASLHNFIFHYLPITNFHRVIIERQVMRNQVAMELMYSLVSMLYPLTSNIVIFDPKLKFTTIGQQYETKNKQHKKQSIENMRKMLATNISPSFEKLSVILDETKKKDDIADSFNQLIIQLKLWKLIEIDLRIIYND